MLRRPPRSTPFPTRRSSDLRCCGMPKLELGDLRSIERLMEANIDELDRYARDGWDLTAVVPSCVLMFKQELPLLFPEDERVKRDRKSTRLNSSHSQISYAVF